MTNHITGLEQFVDRLIQEKGMTNLLPQVLSQIKQDLTKRLENIINAAIVANLSPEKLTEFQNELIKNDEANIQKFIATNVPNLDEILARELIHFRQTYLNQRINQLE